MNLRRPTDALVEFLGARRSQRMAALVLPYLRVRLPVPRYVINEGSKALESFPGIYGSPVLVRQALGDLAEFYFGPLDR